MNNSPLPGLTVPQPNSHLLKLSLSLLIVALTMTHTSTHGADESSRAATLVDAKRPLIIGHRGYPQFAPENTLPSFKLALAAGADLIELDYHHSSDGKLVVVHDFTLDRTTDATNRWGGKKLEVRAKSYADLTSLDAGNWFSPQYTGTRLPLLGNVLDFVNQSGGVTLIERKAGEASACVNLLREKNLVNRVIVQSFDWSYLKAFHELEPQQILGALGPPGTLPNGTKPPDADRTLNEQWLDWLKPTGVKAVVWNDQVTAEAIRLAHQRGLKVWVYTINDPAAANRLLDLGVDGLITNNTSLMWKTVALRKAK
jgi:glycerophosphoryl diester phosphodiesterase